MTLVNVAAVVVEFEPALVVVVAVWLASSLASVD
jgi:hypothetical protein